MVSSFEQLVCDLGSVIPKAAMAEPVDEPDFGAREDEMGIVFAAFKTPAKQDRNATRQQPSADKRRMNGRFRNHSASGR
ncbi:hypothetical protein OE766_09205 [Pararhizobium sp. YC-54]|uniref:hypothetical protein n=1 Tax=Pararhizobium sp. YC-54 TaxID=2986920 RepID=UPI0021F7AB8A|nr:hypothetical protein [Pararhizobium sp. YC-54]MCV9998423.1 hypothetical protein [Pararhizobium sp. YC-54]